MGNNESVVVDELQLGPFCQQVTKAIDSIERLRGPAAQYHLMKDFEACNAQRLILVRQLHSLVLEMSSGLQGALEEAIYDVHVGDVRRAIRDHIGDTTKPVQKRLHQLRESRTNFQRTCTQYMASLQRFQTKLDTARGPDPNRAKLDTSIGVSIAGAIIVAIGALVAIVCPPAGVGLVVAGVVVSGGGGIGIAAYDDYDKLCQQPTKVKTSARKLRGQWAFLCENLTNEGGGHRRNNNNQGPATAAERARNKGVIKMLKNYVRDCNKILGVVAKQMGDDASSCG